MGTVPTQGNRGITLKSTSAANSVLNTVLELTIHYLVLSSDNPMNEVLLALIWRFSD